MKCPTPAEELRRLDVVAATSPAVTTSLVITAHWTAGYQSR
jgi:hypothetical protein